MFFTSKKIDRIVIVSEVGRFKSGYAGDKCERRNLWRGGSAKRFSRGISK